MMRNLLAVMMATAPMLPVSGEVEYVTPPNQLLELRTYHAAPGKLDALLTRFRDHTLALFGKHGMVNVGYWVPVDNKDNLLVFLLAYPDKEARDASWKAFMEDPEWKKAAADSEKEGKLVDKADSLFLKPTDFSAGFAGLEEGKEHLFEMRTYTTVKGRLPNLHARFRDHTLGLFKQHGMTNLAYFQLTPDQPGADDTLLYFLAHKDMDAATKSWADFRADSAWLAAKAASEEKAGGSLTTEDGVVSVFLKSVDFSPVK
jgi:hypothetical protein